MTAPSLLDELEGVVALLDAVDGKEGLVLEKMNMLSSAGLFIRTHHAEIAELVADAWRYQSLKTLTHKDWTVAKDASRGGVFQFTGDDLDAAIDAAMHNSAREDGE